MHPFGGTPICPRCSKAVYAAEQVCTTPAAARGYLTHLLADHGPRKEGVCVLRFHLSPAGQLTYVFTALPQGTCISQTQVALHSLLRSLVSAAQRAASDLILTVSLSMTRVCHPAHYWYITVTNLDRFPRVRKAIPRGEVTVVDYDAHKLVIDHGELHELVP